MMEEPTAEQARAWLATMVRIRKLEETSAELYGKGIIRGFLHLCNGQEAVATGVMAHLKAEDRVLSTYREHGHALARGMTSAAILAELAGKTTGCCGGRGGSMHLFDPDLNFFGGTAIVGAHLPLAAGMALADLKRNRPGVTVCFLGEGAAAEGVFTETLNLAALWKVRLLFVLENNRYAMGTALDLSQATSDFEKKAMAWGVPARSADGMDIQSMHKAAGEMIDSIRTGATAPMLLVAQTYRFRAHSMFDAELYRTKEEVAEWKKRDPIDSWKLHLLERGWMDEQQWKQIEEQAAQEMRTAADDAQRAGTEAVESLETHVYA